jgi:Acyl-CoA synthetases (AMP-forming)/AMP-acid ligases II
MEKIWLKSYPPGVPAEIDTSEFSSINDILRKSCEKFRHRPAFTCMDRSLSYGDLDQMSLRFAAYLQSLGLKKGDRVAVMMPNILQYPIALFGILRAGLIVVNTNPLYTPRELEYQLADSGAKAIVVLENFADTLEKVIAKTQIKHVITTQIGDLLGFPKSLLVNLVIKYKKKMVPAWNIPDAISLSKALSIGANARYTAPDVSLDDLAFLQYTGGTTGVPKGAMLSHGNIVANLLQTSAWIGARFKEGEEVVITALPLYHIFSLTANCLTFMKYGAQNILIINPRDMPGFVAELAKHPFSVITGVNTLFNGLLHTPGFEKLDFSGIKVSLGGGMAVQRAVAERWQQVTGQPLIEAYGLTETSPGVCVNPLNISGYNGTIGLPIPSTIITIRDDNCNILPIGEIGEICIVGPQVMKGYWNKDDETAKVMTPDGAFRSGDIGFMNTDGFVKIVDRKKDLILVSGFKVYPNEIEDVIAMCPGVMEVCAVAAEDEKSGEVVRVAIVKKDPALTKEQVLEYCKTQLTGYKIPKIIEFWKELPKSNVGKVLRREVKNMKAPAA